MKKCDNNQIFIFAGEKSGDLHGSNLIKALKKLLPECHIAGVGGPEMRAQALQCILRMEDFEVMGFSDVLWSLPKLWQQFYTIRDHIIAAKPKAVILIDYPGFNLRMAKALRKKGYNGKIIQYICPSVWAWGKHRIPFMANTLDLLLTIYPFEQQCFSHTKLKVEYVGNPLLENIQKHPYDDQWTSLTGIKDKRHLLAIFPGSREGEILRNLPLQLETAELVKEYNPDSLFAISCAHEGIIPLMHELLQNSSLRLNKDVFLIPKAYTYELMKECRSALAKSGTVTLELALHQKPTVVLYKLSFLNWLIAKFALRVKLPHYCIVNILSGKPVFPELIEKGLTSNNLFNNLKQLHDDGIVRETCISDCKKVGILLKENDASDRAAKAIDGLLA